MIYELHKSRLTVLNFAVHPSAQRRGVGSLLIAKLVYKLVSHHRQKITLAVRERNLGAQMFFHGHGFQATKLLRNYYEDSGEDAYQMELKSPTSETVEGVAGTVNRIANFR
jgi:ribosomal-protein-alanine N-acetyltransferase